MQLLEGLFCDGLPWLAPLAGSRRCFMAMGQPDALCRSFVLPLRGLGRLCSGRAGHGGPRHGGCGLEGVPHVEVQVACKVHSVILFEQNFFNLRRLVVLSCNGT